MSRLTKRPVRRLPAFLTAIALVVAACSASSSPSPSTGVPIETGASASAATSAQPKQGGELIVGLESDITAMDPAFAYDYATTTVVTEVTEGLLKFDHDGKPVPNLAESVDNPDPTTWIYHLRHDVTFQDGSPMTADDVVFSMERTRDPKTASYVAYMFDSVDKIEKVDAYTVRVTLKHPDAFWQYVLATTAGHVISKAYYEAHTTNFGKPDGGLLGTGPFKFVSWNSGSQITLARYDGYWNKANGGPYLDGITFKILPEATTRIAGLQTGDLGAVLYAIPGDQLSVVQKMDGVDLQLVDGYQVDFLAFNTQRAPFNDLRVRQALNYAIDKVAVRKTTLGDFAGDAKATPVGPAFQMFNADLWATAYQALPDYAHNLDTAKTLLSASGVADQLNGKVITTDDNPVRLGEALALQDAASQLGYKLSIKKVSLQDLFTALFSKARDYDIIANNWGPDFPDPAGNLAPTFLSQNTGDGGANFANYKNPVVDTLLNSQSTLADNAQRSQKLIEAEKTIAADSPWIVFDYPKLPFALSKQFVGYQITPLWSWDAFAKDIHLAP